MTLDQALAELGIERDAGADQARRAYLRLLKLRKPETDPQGFMRLREAYELIKARIEAREALFGPMGAAAPARPDPPREAPEIAEEPAEPPAVEAGEPPAAGEPEPAGAPEPGAPVALAAALEETPAAEPERPPAERPEEPPAEEPAAEPEAPPADDADLDALLRAGLHVPAAAEMVGVFDAAARRVHGAPPPALRALDLLVRLHAENEIAPAAALHESLAAWLRASGQEVRVLRGDTAARWSLLRELAGLPGTFPGAVRAAIGRAMLAGDLGHARGDLGAVRRRQPAVARAAAGVLRSRAPLLAATLADTLDPPPAPVATAAPQRSSKGGWAIAMVVIAALRIVMMLARGTSSGPSYSDLSRYRPPRIDLPPFASLDAGLYLPGLDAGLYASRDSSKLGDLERRVLHRADTTRSHAEYMLAGDAGRRQVDYQRVGSDVDAIVIALGGQDCPAARAGMRTLKKRMAADTAAPDELGRVEVQTFERALQAYCAELAKTRAPDASAAEAGRAGPALDAGRCGGADLP